MPQNNIPNTPGRGAENEVWKEISKMFGANTSESFPIGPTPIDIVPTQVEIDDDDYDDDDGPSLIDRIIETIRRLLGPSPYNRPDIAPEHEPEPPWYPFPPSETTDWIQSQKGGTQLY